MHRCNCLPAASRLDNGGHRTSPDSWLVAAHGLFGSREKWHTKIRCAGLVVRRMAAVYRDPVFIGRSSAPPLAGHSRTQAGKLRLHSSPRGSMQLRPSHFRPRVGLAGASGFLKDNTLGLLFLSFNSVQMGFGFGLSLRQGWLRRWRARLFGRGVEASPRRCLVWLPPSQGAWRSPSQAAGSRIVGPWPPRRSAPGGA